MRADLPLTACMCVCERLRVGAAQHVPPAMPPTVYVVCQLGNREESAALCRGVERSNLYWYTKLCSQITNAAAALQPYRMFTSRSEYRLLLRCDNAHLRLTPRSQAIGLCCPQRALAFEATQRSLQHGRALLTGVALPPREWRQAGIQVRGFGVGSFVDGGKSFYTVGWVMLQVSADGVRRSPYEMLKFPNVSWSQIIAAGVLSGRRRWRRRRRSLSTRRLR